MKNHDLSTTESDRHSMELHEVLKLYYFAKVVGDHENLHGFITII